MNNPSPMTRIALLLAGSTTTLLENVFSPSKLVEQATSGMDILAQKKGVEFSSYIDPNLPQAIFGDERRIRHAARHGVVEREDLPLAKEASVPVLQQLGPAGADQPDRKSPDGIDPAGIAGPLPNHPGESHQDCERQRDDKESPEIRRHAKNPTLSLRNAEVLQNTLLSKPGFGLGFPALPRNRRLPAFFPLALCHSAGAHQVS